jgi:hypothetical protein
MTELYKALATALKERIKWIDLDAGQIESSESRKPLAYPCALFKFTFSPSDISEGGDQLEQCTITVRLAFDVTGSRTSADTPEDVLARSLAWSQTADEAYSDLQGREFSDFGELECTGRYQEDRNDGLVVWRMTFKSSRWLFK